CHLIIFDSHHMAADVMAPHAVSNVGGCSCKVRLESKRCPGHNGISGKSYGIAVASRSCVSGKSHRAFSLSPTVQIMVMVQHPKRVQSFYLAEASGLPVKPPEIHALFFHRMENMFKACFQEIGI